MFDHIADGLKATYSTNDDVTNVFFNPVLSESISYQRVSGFFSSKALALYATGLDRLADAGGKVRFIISTKISREDFLQIKTGYQLRDALSLNDENLNDEDQKKIGNLAYMISQKCADIKFGFRESGLCHSKWGYFEDESGQDIYFIGSNNETGSGMVENYEDFDVDFSWDTSKHVRDRILQKKKQFELMWQNKMDEISILPANDLMYDMIQDFDKGHIQSLPGRDENALILEKSSKGIFFADKTEEQVSSKASFRRNISFYMTEADPNKVKPDMTYKQIDTLIKLVKKYTTRKNVKFYVGDMLQEYLDQQRYSINEYRQAGLTIKSGNDYWKEQYDQFKKIVNNETNRPLKEEQMRAAFYFYIQKRAANFSVPGSGKTSTMLGTFAFLNRGEHPTVKRMLVISPLNAFMSWEDEFKTEFESKKNLEVVTSNSGAGAIISNWAKSNLVLVNYESLISKDLFEALQDGLKKDGKETMLIFDEVHRIKGVQSVRAAKALLLPEYTEYRYVMTGTPIPNGYIDIWNFLHILYQNEFSSYFGFTQQELQSNDDDLAKTIDDKLAPFFWRTNKQKLGVPDAEKDDIEEVPASREQERLASMIYETESNPLAVMIRMMQLSTNPSLLSKDIDMDEVDNIIPEDPGNDGLAELRKSMRKSALSNVDDIDVSGLIAPKFKAGVDRVDHIVSEGRKVVVWALFVDTIDKIVAALENKGIRAVSVYGATKMEDRESTINKFKEANDDIQVLVTNPNTLGESMSLHMVVHDAVYFEYNYNLTFMLQSRDRIHRLGLAPNVKTRYWYLMTVSDLPNSNFIDKKIYNSLKEKETRMLDAIDKGILEPDVSENEMDEVTRIINSERKK